MLGYGLNSYFSIVKHLMVMMSIIMIVSVPLMLIYASYNDLSTLPGYEFNAFSLGNIGGSTAVCAVTTFQNDSMEIPLKCRSGQLSMTAVAENTQKPLFDYGIIPASSQVISYCSNGAFEDASRCSEYIDSERLMAGLQENCIGKSSCSVSNLKSLIMTDKAGFNAAECNNAESFMFI